MSGPKVQHTTRTVSKRSAITARTRQIAQNLPRRYYFRSKYNACTFKTTWSDWDYFADNHTRTKELSHVGCADSCHSTALQYFIFVLIAIVQHTIALKISFVNWNTVWKKELYSDSDALASRYSLIQLKPMCTILIFAICHSNLCIYYFEWSCLISFCRDVRSTKQIEYDTSTMGFDPTTFKSTIFDEDHLKVMFILGRYT